MPHYVYNVHAESDANVYAESGKAIEWYWTEKENDMLEQMYCATRAGCAVCA